ncbi:SO_0444 family Cu/Zn efflux transporter [Marinomonas ostreistagni]|uniref:SO_0444 family Cu/Zn efflux transporter n=1 Tax=Marinomonas ostreistagni TaxID=359209 RepID=A0ABS0Z8M1_9GAMM|nr:SO_0444 family Cu/Zn efflux transporter [Marinomonas ostreistagni]MBJ7549969.1 SO_0444 family Cu/Zn efflux transporter [Marinomonas ostreistagni]
MNWFNALIELFLESAPWLILGLVIAGLLKEFVPMSWMEKQLGRRSRFSVVKAAFIGAPLPLCSCGVIPAAAGLRKAGATKGATTSFLISTPETGVDSIALSWALLGPFMAIIRPIAAITSAVTAGFLVGKDESITPSDDHLNTTSSCATKGCCSQKKPDAPLSISQRFIRGMRYAATEMVDDIAIWLVIGLGFAALVQAYIPQSFLAEWGNGLLAMLVMMIISIPMYICATASTPIAAGLLVVGVSPGAVLVFMLAGPATNIATLGVVHKLLGKRALFSYLSGVMICALGFGFLANQLFVYFNWQIVPATVTPNEHNTWWAILSSIVLAILILMSITKSFSFSTRRRTHNH